MTKARDTNDSWFERAKKSIPGGVDSPVRSFASVGGTPFTVVRGEGSRVWDVEGRPYIDLVQSYGAVLLGHAHPLVTDAIREAALLGTTFGEPTPGETELAEAICSRVPGCDQVRLVSSGTEAAMSAVRVARGFTGRDRVVKFDGCYHGHSDTLLAASGSGVAMLGLSGSVGVPASAVADTLVVPYNDVPFLDERVACVIVEPIAANMGVVPPWPGFLSGLREMCDEIGALLIFDEVITGFRVGSGGATAWSGVTPDLWCFGKVIGGGLPLAAFGGRRDVLSVLAPEGPVYQAGTLSGNPLATAAGLAVLDGVSDDDYATLTGRVARFASDLSDAIGEAGLAVTVPRVGPLVGLFFSEEPVTDYEGAKAAVASGLYAPFFRALLDRGVALAPGPYEAMFPGFSHSVADLGAVAEAARDAAREARSAVEA
ncbi:MAG TPA: glutamate-1-semialdehyde 2,1-aminomutase [Acidimicrobiales bacterium]|nr:glutamate-1-semialdehyde 2,1-aminomutase [Acidimicrobiales bacterium]